MVLHLFGSKVLSLVAKLLVCQNKAVINFPVLIYIYLYHSFFGKTLDIYELLPSLYQYQTIVASVILLLPNKIGEEISWY